MAILNFENRSLILAEIGQSHEGSMVFAKSLFEMVAHSGADGVKVQMHFPEHESSIHETFRSSDPTGDASRQDYWKRTSFTPDQWAELRAYAASLGLLFVPSVFSSAALEMVNHLEIDALKVGSAEVLQPWFVDSVVMCGHPTIFSSGMSTWVEMAKLANRALLELPSAVILQCTSRYPTKLSDVGIGMIHRIRSELGVFSGLSDHSGSISPSLAALSLGANIVEVHVIPHRGLRGFDSSSSITFEELGLLVSFRNDIETMHSSHYDKDFQASELAELRKIFGRSIFPKEKIKAGVVLEQGMFVFKKPAGGIPPSSLDRLIGKVAKVDLEPDRFVAEREVVTPCEK